MIDPSCCGDPSDCDGCTLTHPEIEQLAAEQAASTYVDGEGNQAPLDEARGSQILGTEEQSSSRVQS